MVDLKYKCLPFCLKSYYTSVTNYFHKQLTCFMEVFFCTDYSNFQEARGGSIWHQGPKRTSYLILKWARPKSILCCLRYNYMLNFISQWCQIWSKLSLSWLWICWSYYQIHWGLGNLLTATLRKGGGRISFQRINPQRYPLLFHGGLCRATANCEMCPTIALLLS